MRDIPVSPFQEVTDFIPVVRMKSNRFVVVAGVDIAVVSYGAAKMGRNVLRESEGRSNLLRVVFADYGLVVW